MPENHPNQNIQESTEKIKSESDSLTDKISSEAASLADKAEDTWDKIEAEPGGND